MWRAAFGLTRKYNCLCAVVRESFSSLFSLSRNAELFKSPRCDPLQLEHRARMSAKPLSSVLRSQGTLPRLSLFLNEPNTPGTVVSTQERQDRPGTGLTELTDWLTAWTMRREPEIPCSPPPPRPPVRHPCSVKLVASAWQTPRRKRWSAGSSPIRCGSYC